MDYLSFLDSKSQYAGDDGFEVSTLPSFLMDFQSHLVSYALRKGRSGIFADCGLGKTPMQLAWADQVVRHTNDRVLILTPLAVVAQTLEESAKFGIEASRSHHGEIGGPGIYVTNYERLRHFPPSDFVGVVCDESSIL